MSARTRSSESATSSSGSLTVQLTQSVPCQKAIKAHLAPDAVKPARDTVVGEFQREATIAGFRKGKAPRELVERKYPNEIREEVVRRLTRQVFEQITTEHHLRPISAFEISKLEFTEQGLDLEAQVEVEPEFKLAEYKAIPVKKPPAVVTAEDREQAFQQLQESMAELVPAQEGAEKEKRVPTRDDEFAKDLGFESLAKLTEHLEAKLQEQKLSQQRQAMEQVVTDALLAKHQFDVPKQLVERQAERLMRDFQARLLLNGYNEEQAKAELDKCTEQLRGNAAQHVKLTLILERIAEQESLSITQDELVDRLWKLSRQWGKDPAEVRRLLDERGLWPSVTSSIRQEKSLKLVLDAANVEEPAS